MSKIESAGQKTNHNFFTAETLSHKMKTNYTAYGKTYLVGRTVSIPNIKWYLDHAVTLQFQIYSLVLEQTDYSSISTSRSWGKEGGVNSVKIFLFSFSVKGFI